MTVIRNDGRRWNEHEPGLVIEILLKFARGNVKLDPFRMKNSKYLNVLATSQNRGLSVRVNLAELHFEVQLLETCRRKRREAALVLEAVHATQVHIDHER